MSDQNIINLIDKTISEISGRQLVSCSEITDVLLDIRSMVNSIQDASASPTYEMVSL